MDSKFAPVDKKRFEENGMSVSGTAFYVPSMSDTNI